ncbi:hypothetical protein Dxin01_03387 [Deinococcus xinjiangensis]|uniref:Uncharacterized protein n=1 Tax=Deinococcus xinjiangensis TaxID=457454 RepID=A0ABP9VHR9_9DEIO
MKFLLSTVLAATASTALALGTPIKSLVTGSGGQLTIEDGLYVVSKRTSDLTYLQMGVGTTQASAGRIQGLTLFAFREYLKPSELALLISNTRRVATTCFNLSQGRMDAIAYWLTVQNKSAYRNVTSSFGPMNLRFKRDVTSDGTYYTAVYMNRSGLPGQTPWINYCTDGTK